MPGPRELVEHFGGHPSDLLGLDLTREADLDRWLLAACLLSQPGGEARALAAFRALITGGLAAIQGPPEDLAEILAAAGWRRPQAPARLLSQLARELRRQGGSARMGREADGLEELGTRLSALAPGLGRAAVTRFLRPLREHWPAALEIPLSRAARAAARHLGWLGADEDESGEPGALRAWLREQGDAPVLADVEAALERLGSAACLRGAMGRCPLRASCPARGASGSGPGGAPAGAAPPTG